MVETNTKVTIEAPKIVSAVFTIVGTSPYVQNKFSAKARRQIMDTQSAGSTSRKGKRREAKDFEECFREAQHIAREGWNGIPAPAFRNAMISACRLCGFKMTLAKMSIFIRPDGFDKDDGTPLVKIIKGKPTMHTSYVRNDSGVVDMRARPIWQEGWQARVCVQYDGHQFTLEDVSNLLMRAGIQVGVGEGRPDSKDGAGMGWGTFTVEATRP